MKYLKWILILFFAQTTANVLIAQQAGASEMLLKKFQQQTETWKYAYNSGDADKLSALYTEDARYISSHVTGLELDGRDKVIANFQNGMKIGGRVDSVEILTMNMSGELVTLLCKYQATNSGETVVGRNLLVLKKTKGKWLIVIHMTVV